MSLKNIEKKKNNSLSVYKTIGSDMYIIPTIAMWVSDFSHLPDKEKNYGICFKFLKFNFCITYKKIYL